MINRIIAYSVKNKLIIGLATLALIAAGIWSMTKVPLDAVPDITNNQVQVITQAPNLSTEDIEQFVTYPVEVAMANLPGVTEIRSVSRFGLSVVTIVFEDDMGTYLPRQLVSGKLVSVREEIPQGFGAPEMGPISTGLGEIYQYTLEVDSAWREKYTDMDLRTIQDWIIRRQMAMVQGVVEVNAFGGSIKQYEVAVNPDALKAMNISIGDVFNALRENNANTGGAYIEKNHHANFIRGNGLARSIEDIGNTLVVSRNGLPVKVRDIAEVRFGNAVRYGAFTKDGRGEAVGGMILMLKGANSNEVIGAVKERIAEIQKSLPEGVRIQPFLDRSTLISETTNTVSGNLIEGALIVIFVLVFLLGNLRGGLIVASTIPLSLCFAFILMYAFDVWANLMSLGAIDFGIIVDGAVIIVEGTVVLLFSKKFRQRKLSPFEKDEVTIEASSKMMNAAFFGQLIVLIVFIPILALEGVEGKMFKPMAFTFMFAMLGAMILCLTYVPMMSALLLKHTEKKKPSPGDRLFKRMRKGYGRLLNGAFRRPVLIVVSAIVLLGLSMVVFTRMGGEFIPQLDEGDIAFHTMLKPGSSLSETIQTTTLVEKMVLENFPEVTHIYSRIGVADVPTDPMPMDIADCVVLLKPRAEWKSGRTKTELIEAMKQKLAEVPGVNFEFTQPIEMRFNELLTGVRSDVAVKLFGEDLTILNDKAHEIGKIISGVPGVGDLTVEATSGLPQMTIKYNRSRMAQYGLQINEVNEVVRAAFAGEKAGAIFEGERRFDLVVRLEEAHRQGLDDLKNLYISLGSGSQIPITQVADIKYEPGPMQISRDNTNRRTYVGINVRGRDVKSLVEDIRTKLDKELSLPPGYYIRYGGAFENLERATERLQILVPISLALIFLLIFFALRSLKHSLMIYITIPMAAIGGVFSLWIRGMPFSISAGVGFIVLFGVAVLNGLVLISAWNELKDDGKYDLDERIRRGAARRLRPVMLTALTDILGFLPMAVSTSAGAEVQRPLATVVIGGMVSATLLTLFVLPIVYRWLEAPGRSRSLSARGLAGLVVLLILPLSLKSQNADTITQVEDAVAKGLENNPELINGQRQLEIYRTDKKSAWNLPKTELGVQFGDLNGLENDAAFSVGQAFDFPTLYAARKKLASAKLESGEWEYADAVAALKREIRTRWIELAALHEELKLLAFQDSLYHRNFEAAKLRFDARGGSFLEKATAESRAREVRKDRLSAELDLTVAEEALRLLLNDTTGLRFLPDTLRPWIPPREIPVISTPVVRKAQQEVVVSDEQTSVENARLLPTFSLGYINQSIIGLPLPDGTLATASDRFSVFQAGIAIPIFFGAAKADIKKAKLAAESARTEAGFIRLKMESLLRRQRTQIQKYSEHLKYYHESALPLADQIIHTANISFNKRAIGYIEYFENMNQAINLKKEYIRALKLYNQSIIDLNYLTGQ